jgi:hypothetical protein
MNKMLREKGKMVCSHTEGAAVRSTDITADIKKNEILSLQIDGSSSYVKLAGSESQRPHVFSHANLIQLQYYEKTGHAKRRSLTVE